jgi:hypothetical protein
MQLHGHGGESGKSGKSCGSYNSYGKTTRGSGIGAGAGVGTDGWPTSHPLSSLYLYVMPTRKGSTTSRIDWGKPIREFWGFGESKAQEQLVRFMEEGAWLFEGDTRHR